MSIELEKRVSIDPEISEYVARFDEAMGEPGLDIPEFRRRYATLLLKQDAHADPVSTRELAIPTVYGEGHAHALGGPDCGRIRRVSRRRSSHPARSTAEFPRVGSADQPVTRVRACWQPAELPL